MATSLQRYVTARQAQRARPVAPPPARRTTPAQPLVPVTRVQPRNTMSPPRRQPAVDTMAPPVPRPIAAPVTAPGQRPPPAAAGQQAPAAPPSFFQQPLAPEFAAPPPDPLLGGRTPGDALGGGLTMKQPQQQPQMAQLLSVMPPDFAAQITPEQLAALTPDQMTQMIVKFSQPQAPMRVGHGDELINPRRSAADSSSSNIPDYRTLAPVSGLGRSNPSSM